MKISVVVPVKNEDYCIACLLDDLIRQTAPPDEIVITDGGSDDRTCDIIESYISEGHPITLVRTDHAYPGTGRNLAIAYARNELIAMVDAGIRVESLWLEELLKPISRDPSIDVVYGNYVPMRHSLFQECAAVVYVAAPVRIDGRLMRHHSVASCLIRKRVWEEIGGFPDLRVGEDLIFMDRIEQGCYRVAYAPGAVVHWYIRTGFRKTYRYFSMASLLAIRGGFWRIWHRGILRMYALGSVFLVLGFVHTRLWWLGLVIAALARTLKLLLAKREDHSVLWTLNPSRLFHVFVIMLTVDLATFTGIGRWVLLDKLQMGTHQLHDDGVVNVPVKRSSR